MQLQLTSVSGDLSRKLSAHHSVENKGGQVSVPLQKLPVGFPEAVSPTTTPASPSFLGGLNPKGIEDSLGTQPNITPMTFLPSLSATLPPPPLSSIKVDGFD